MVFRTSGTQQDHRQRELPKRTREFGSTVPHAGFPVDHTSPSPDLNAVQASTPSLPLPVWLLVCLLLLGMEELDQFSRLACVWRAERGIKAPRAGAIWPQTAAIGTLRLYLLGQGRVHCNGGVDVRAHPQPKHEHWKL